MKMFVRPLFLLVLICSFLSPVQTTQAKAADNNSASISAWFEVRQLHPELHIDWVMSDQPNWMTIQKLGSEELPIMFTSSEQHGDNVYLDKIWGIEFHFGFIYFTQGETYTIRIRTGSYNTGPNFNGIPLVETTVMWPWTIHLPIINR